MIPPKVFAMPEALEAEDRALAALLVAVCTQGEAAVRERLEQARSAGLPCASIDELLLMAPLYAGVPRAVRAFGAWRGLEPEVAAPRFRTEFRAEAGARTFAAVYGARAERVRAELARMHPDLEAWIVAAAYGEVLARPLLSLKQKELFGVAALTAQAAERQLASHVLGARRAGADGDEIESAAALGRAGLSAEELRAMDVVLREALIRPR